MMKTKLWIGIALTTFAFLPSLDMASHKKSPRRWRRPSSLLHDISRQGFLISQGPFAQTIFTTAVGVANTVLTLLLDNKSQIRDQGFSRDIEHLQIKARKASVDISSLQAKVTALESSNTQLCNKINELITGWEQFNTDLGAITGTAPDLVAAITAIVTNRPTCS